MTAAATVVAVVAALLVGLLAGFAMARGWRARIVEVAPSDDGLGPSDDDTRPTLVPFRLSREGGRSLARTDPGEGETAEERDQLDALLADLDRRPKR